MEYRVVVGGLHFESESRSKHSPDKDVVPAEYSVVDRRRDLHEAHPLDQLILLQHRAPGWSVEPVVPR